MLEAGASQVHLRAGDQVVSVRGRCVKGHDDLSSRLQGLKHRAPVLADAAEEQEVDVLLKFGPNPLEALPTAAEREDLHGEHRDLVGDPLPDRGRSHISGR